MKKFLALILALVIAASLAVTVSAVTYDSPTPTDYYSITTSVEGSGTASAALSNGDLVVSGACVAIAGVSVVAFAPVFFVPLPQAHSAIPITAQTAVTNHFFFITDPLF